MISNWSCSRTLLSLVTLLLLHVYITTSTITISDHGYSGIVIAIDPAVDESTNPGLIQSIRDAFTEASARLYQVTGRRAYFKDITIVVPTSWSPLDTFDTYAGERGYIDADVRVSGLNDGSPPRPVRFSMECGVTDLEGYIHINSIHVNNWNVTNFSKLIVSFWAQIRYGVIVPAFYPMDQVDHLTNESIRCSRKFANPGPISQHSPDAQSIAESVHQRGLWEVIRMHEDYTHMEPPGVIRDTTPIFRMIRDQFPALVPVDRSGVGQQPGRITDLRVITVDVNQRQVSLQWTAQVDHLKAGAVSAYEIRLEHDSNLEYGYKRIHQVEVLVGNLSSSANASTVETFVIQLPDEDAVYYLSVVTLADGRGSVSNSVAVSTHPMMKITQKPEVISRQRRQAEIPLTGLIDVLSDSCPSATLNEIIAALSLACPGVTLSEAVDAVTETCPDLTLTAITLAIAAAGSEATFADIIDSWADFCVGATSSQLIDALGSVCPDITIAHIIQAVETTCPGLTFTADIYPTPVPTTTEGDTEETSTQSTQSWTTEVSASAQTVANPIAENDATVWYAVGSILAAFAILLVVNASLFLWRRYRNHPKDGSVELGQMGFSGSNSNRLNISALKEEDNWYEKASIKQIKEFQDLASMQSRGKRKVGMLPCNSSKNRTGAPIPFDDHRVRLKKENTRETSDYINASYLPSYKLARGFIVTQGCLPSTVNDFWEMIWQEECKGIVLLTRSDEEAQSQCEIYWPARGDSAWYGHVHVQNLEETHYPSWSELSLEITKVSESQHIRFYQYTDWCDTESPTQVQSFVNFVSTCHNKLQGVTVAVQCSDGAGRSAVYLMLDRMIHILVNKIPTVDIYKEIIMMRKYRPDMVNTQNYYLFLYKCIARMLAHWEEDPIYEYAS